MKMAVSEHFLTISLAKVFSFSFIKHRIYEKPCSLGQSKCATRRTIHVSVLFAKKMSNSKEQEHGAIFSWHDAWYLTYGIVMFLILSIGFLGNALTVLILRKPEHVRKALTPLMINLSIGSLIIIVLGYPVVMTLLLTGGQVGEDDPTCR